MENELKKRILSSIILIPISLIFVIQGSIFFLFFLIVLFFFTSFEWINLNKKKNLTIFFGILYLIVSFYSAYILRESEGLDLFLFIILICISTDIGGYFFGKTLGGPKLTKISPKKTYAGMIGSFLLSLIIGLIVNEYNSNKILYSQFEVINFIIFISLLSQVGDLIISYFKRKAKIKDTGKILPGHGGLLDRLDGIIFVFMSLYLIKFI